MASAGYHGSREQDQVGALVGQVKNLTVERLKNVLRQEGLTVSGVKSELQIRLIAHIENAQNARDQARLDRIRNLVAGQLFYGHNINGYPSPYSSSTPASSASPQFSSPAPRGPHQSSAYNMSPSHGMLSSRVTFRNTTFYRILRPLTMVIECRARETTRDTARATVNLSQDVVDQMHKDPTIRIMVYCAGETYPGSLRECDISFPHRVELKCNGEEIRANLTGLKNKPGSTRPADVTPFIKKRAGHPNSVEMIYALTSKKYFMMVNLVEKKPIDSLIAELRRGNFLSKERVLQEMQTKASDTDIVATSSVLSLKCPISYTRLQIPCRSSYCNHNQCFDATSFLQLQEQAPTWICPICNKSAVFDTLVIDQYVLEILNSTSADTEQVTVEPDGKWHKQVETNGESKQSKPSPTDDDDDDDLIEIGDDPASFLKFSTPLRTPSVQPPFEKTTTPTTKSNKRTRDEVIDLTLSDDDDEPPAKVKRPSMSSSESFRSRLPEKFHFNLPPPSSTNGFNYERFGPSL